ncbi:hypothetical protein F5884DRAFT_896366 [Xylogone sp. PMI_703]|nr:hypothetical protein F5884DRAFT_896366 [Xylogone sp. PMI_703]
MDCYCAICGGPFCKSSVAQKPRSRRFRQRHGLDKQAKNRDGQKQGDFGTNDNDDDDDSSDDERSLNSEEEDHTFDPEVISPSTSAWMEQLHILSTRVDLETGDVMNHVNQEHACSGYVSGRGEYRDSARIDVGPGDDPNFDRDAELICYDGSFPFHWCCFELLAIVLEGKVGVSGINKARLYYAMFSSYSMFSSCLDKLDYGDPSPAHDQFWCTEAGKEFIVVHPMKLLKKTNKVILEKSLELAQEYDSSAIIARISHVKHDPFQTLPTELIEKICGLLSIKSLTNLAAASVPIDTCLLDRNFWTRYIEKTIPWNFEALRLLNNASNDLVNQAAGSKLQMVNFKKLLLWIDKESAPRGWMSGPFLGIANRRRIWNVCEQLKEAYSKTSRMVPVCLQGAATKIAANVSSLPNTEVSNVQSFPLASEMTYKCKFCDSTFGNSARLKIHYRRRYAIGFNKILRQSA